MADQGRSTINTQGICRSELIVLDLIVHKVNLCYFVVKWCAIKSSAVFELLKTYWFRLAMNFAPNERGGGDLLCILT